MKYTFVINIFGAAFVVVAALALLVTPANAPKLVFAQAGSVFTVNSTDDKTDGIPGDGVCDTGTTGRTGICTLRAALREADATPELDEIRFNIISTNEKIIVDGNLGSLGALQPVIVDGTTQPGSHTVLIDGSQAGTLDPGGGEIVGFELVGKGSTVRGLEIADFALDGFRIRPSGGPTGENVVEKNLIAFNGRHGVHIVESPNNLIGGTASGAGNVIIKNKGKGVRIEGKDASDNLVQGNRIGTNREGTSDSSNEDDAVSINDAPNTTVGAKEEVTAPQTCTGACNLIVGKKRGVAIEGLLSTNAHVHGNFLGKDDIAATFETGIFARGGNLFSASGDVITKVSGVEVDVFADFDGKFDLKHLQLNATADQGMKLGFGEGRDVTIGIKENFIKNARMSLQAEEAAHGTFNWDVFGNQGEAEQTAVSLLVHGGGEKKFKGDTWTAKAGSTFMTTTRLSDDVIVRMILDGEVIAGSGQHGVAANFEGTGQIFYTLIGGSSKGKLGDAYDLDVGASFSGKVNASITGARGSLSGSSGFFLVNRTGSIGLATVFFERDFATNNHDWGINIIEWTVLKRSIDDSEITGNGVGGIRLAGGTQADLARNIISGNGIGILLEDSAKATIIGNTLSGNGLALALAGSGVGTTISANSIFGNAGLGIDLGNNGVTPNDPQDADTGANGLQNFPVLTSFTSNGTATSIQGSLNSRPNTTFILEFFANHECDPSGFGEGEIFLGSSNVTTDANGNVNFSASVPTSVANDQFITATATDPGGSTSEFSQCLGAAISPINTIESLITQVQSLDVPRGLKTNLLSKLQAALISLNQGNTKAAINQLKIFIHELNAHKGKKIASVQADQLIASTQQIINSLQEQVHRR